MMIESYGTMFRTFVHDHGSLSQSKAGGYTVPIDREVERSSPSACR